MVKFILHTTGAACPVLANRKREKKNTTKKIILETENILQIISSFSLNDALKEQHDAACQKNPGNATRIIAKIATVRPNGKRRNKDQNNKECEKN